MKKPVSIARLCWNLVGFVLLVFLILNRPQTWWTYAGIWALYGTALEIVEWLFHYMDWETALAYLYKVYSLLGLLLAVFFFFTSPLAAKVLSLALLAASYLVLRKEKSR